LRAVTWSRLVCFVSVVLLVSGCGAGDIDRGPYIRKNEAIRKSLPTYPGAVIVKVAHYEGRCCGEGDDPGPIVSYGTSTDYRVHAGTRPKVVSAFYKRRLKGWRVVRDFRPCPATSACPPTSTWFARGKASIAVGMDDLRPHVRDNDRGKGGRIFSVSVDHNYYGWNRDARLENNVPE
jgi:hypothetical protein